MKDKERIEHVFMLLGITDAKKREQYQGIVEAGIRKLKYDENVVAYVKRIARL